MKRQEVGPRWQMGQKKESGYEQHWSEPQPALLCLRLGRKQGVAGDCCVLSLTTSCVINSDLPVPLAGRPEFLSEAEARGAA